MELRQRLYDVDDVWELYCQQRDDHRRYELIDGEIIEMSGPGGVHGRIAVRLGRYLDIFAEDNNLGIVTGESGYHPPDDRHNLLLPDVAFVSKSRAPDPFPERFVPTMPDIAVEILSPSNRPAELREKARRYLRLGATLVWIISPNEATVEVCRLRDAGQIDSKMDSEILDRDDVLSGEDVLPGFTLEVRLIFA